MNVKKSKAPRLTREQMQIRIRDLEAQLVSNHHFASQAIKKASVDNLMGSAAIVSIVGLGGKVIVEPIAIRDGLSDETIECLKKDIERSFRVAIAAKPA